MKCIIKKCLLDLVTNICVAVVNILQNKDKFDLDYHQFIDKNECARA